MQLEDKTRKSSLNGVYWLVEEMIEKWESGRVETGWKVSTAGEIRTSGRTRDQIGGSGRETEEEI